MLRLAGLRWLACWRTPMEEVRVLDYAHSSLYDVPGEVFLYERTLEELILDSNRVKDLPRPLFHCHGLKILRMCDNDLVSLPEAICDLVQLQLLDVSRNALTAFPDSVNACKRLTVINVSCNPLLRLPEGITQLISLQELYLNDTDLEFLPANVGRLSKLRILEVRDNRLASLPTAMARLKQLQRLDIGHNEFQAWPEVISHLSGLNELLCDLNEFTTIPPWIGNLQDLTCIDASNNRIQVVALELGSCFKLLDIRLSYNELQFLPHTIGHLKNLITLKVDHNYLEQLPDSIGCIDTIEEIVACHNNIKFLTPQVGLLRKLRLLDLDDNRLEEIPAEVGSCKNLRVLSVRQNELTSIPPELGHLPVIRVLNLADNNLQNLPVSILNLMTLQALWLSDIQSSPLVQLHQEFDAYLGRRVLTGILLPQQPTHNLAPREDDAEWAEAVLIRRSGRIRFSQDLSLSDDEPGVLLRAPTPYPKELRMLAKQARNMSATVAARAKVASLFVEDVVGPSPTHSNVHIKEAKVKRPHEGMPVSPETLQESEYGGSQRSYLQYDVKKALIGQTSFVYAGHPISPESRELETIETNRIRTEEQDTGIYANGRSYDLVPNNNGFDGNNVVVDISPSGDIPIQDLSLVSPENAGRQSREEPYKSSPYASSDGHETEGNSSRHQRRPITREESFRFCREEEASQYAHYKKESPYGDTSRNKGDAQIASSTSSSTRSTDHSSSQVVCKTNSDCPCTANRIVEVRAQRVVFEQSQAKTDETPTRRPQVRIGFSRHNSFSINTSDPNGNNHAMRYHDSRLTYQNICHKPVESIYNNNAEMNGSLRRTESIYGTCKPRNNQNVDTSIYSNRQVYSNYRSSPEGVQSMRPIENYTHESVYGTSPKAIYGTRTKENGGAPLCPPTVSSAESYDEQIVML